MQVVPASSLSARDVDALSALLARAFLHDPMQAWLFPNLEKRPARLRRFFELDMRHRLCPAQVVMRSDRTGVAFWHPPGTWRPSGTKLSLAPAFASLVGPRAWRAYRALRAVEARHPGEQHWYLSHLAVEPEVQDHGVGSALVRAGLGWADYQSVGAYLETANYANLAFYQQQGFAQVGRTSVPAGPPVWALWRNAQGTKPDAVGTDAVR